MSTELSELEKTLQRTKKEFLATAKRATKELDRQRKKLRAEIIEHYEQDVRLVGAHRGRRQRGKEHAHSRKGELRHVFSPVCGVDGVKADGT